MANNFGRVNVSITASTGGLTAGLGRASKQLSGFAGQAGGIRGQLTAMAAGFVGAGRGASMAAVGVKALSLAIKTLLGPLLIITSLVELFARVGRTSSDLDNASKSAARLGMSMTTFQNLKMMAEEAGVEIGQMTNLLTRMSVNLGGLANGSKTAQKAFAGIGLALADLQGLKPEQQFDKISAAIMALPQGERLRAATQIFGTAGAAAMGLIVSAASGTRAEIAKLQADLGVTFSDEQLKRGLPQGIKMMNDALARMSTPLQGFLNQFIGELAPAITTVANLFVKFFAENTSGFSIATTLAKGFSFVIRQIAGSFTFMYGVFQVVSAAIGLFIAGWIKLLEGVSYAIKNAISVMAAAAEALPGFDIGLASSLRAAERSMGAVAGAASREAAVWGQAAADNFAKGIENIGNPYAAFDREFASVQKQMEDAGQAAGQGIGDGMQSGVKAAVKASTEALKAIVVGSSEGEAFMNSIRRGADPRNADDAAQQTADNTERTADAVEGLEDELAGIGGIGLASILA